MPRHSVRLGGGTHRGGSGFLLQILLYARDLANEVPSVSLDRDGYLPGVYIFWRFALWATGGSVGRVGWVYLALLALNAILTAVVLCVRRSPRVLLSWAAFGTWRPLPGTRGSDGLTEPIATAPLLLGLAIWAGRPLRGDGGTRRALALGAGIGLALYVKQPAGLLALGALALIADNVRNPSRPPHAWSLLIALPVVAGLLFLTAVLGEGAGLLPLRIALRLLPIYVHAWAENGQSAPGQRLIPRPPALAPLARLVSAVGGALDGLASRCAQAG